MKQQQRRHFPLVMLFLISVLTPSVVMAVSGTDIDEFDTKDDDNSALFDWLPGETFNQKVLASIKASDDREVIIHRRILPKKTPMNNKVENQHIYGTARFFNGYIRFAQTAGKEERLRGICAIAYLAMAGEKTVVAYSHTNSCKNADQLSIVKLIASPSRTRLTP